jgi:predicted O-methyltransferase YrrM
MQIFSEKVNRLLLDLEKNSEEFWNVPREVGQLLYFLVRAKGAKKVLEIGTSNGYSGIWLAKAARANGGKLITVESHAGRFGMAEGNFAEAGLSDSIMQIAGHAPEVFPTVPEINEGGFEVIFMDATKAQHIEYLRALLPLMKQGALLIADNVLSHAEKMQGFVELISQMPEMTGEVLKIGDGVLIACKL